MSNVYSKKDIQKLELNKMKQYFKSLVYDIKDEEPNIIKYIKEHNISFDFTRSIAVFSKIQCYKSFSTYGIMKYFNKDTRYQVVEISFLLDIWFNNSTLISKDSLLECDILILHINELKWQAETKTNALLELLNTRKIMNKVTWLYIENCSSEEFEALYPGVLKLIRKKYTFNI